MYAIVISERYTGWTDTQMYGRGDFYIVSKKISVYGKILALLDIQNCTMLFFISESEFMCVI